MHNKSSEVCIKTKSTPASLPFRGQVNKPTTVKWSIGCGSLVKEEFLKQPVGNSNTYDLKLENAMSGEFNVMIVQTLET